MTNMDVFVKKTIEIPDTVTIRGAVCRAEFYDDEGYDEDCPQRYTYYMFIDENYVPWEIRIYERSMNNEVFVAAAVHDSGVESCYTAADSLSVTKAIESMAKFLNEYKE